MSIRDYKNITSGNYYHVFNRGNAKMDIFCDEQDFMQFIKRIRLLVAPPMVSKMPFDIFDIDSDTASRIRLTPLGKNALNISAYCFMPNHYHFCLSQNQPGAISQFIHRLCTSYTKYFNKKYHRVGCLFQDQFKIVHVKSDEQLLWLKEYIHQNPVRKDIVTNPDKYRWSSSKMSKMPFDIRLGIIPA